MNCVNGDIQSEVGRNRLTPDQLFSGRYYKMVVDVFKIHPVLPDFRQQYRV